MLKKPLLLIATAILIYYLLVSFINLGLRLTSTRQPECNPLFCREIVGEAAYCLISTPGAENCLKVAGVYFVPSTSLAYLGLFISFGAALLISRKFILTRWLVMFSLLAVIVFCFRVFLGAASFSAYGILYEFQKLGLY